MGNPSAIYPGIAGGSISVTGVATFAHGLGKGRKVRTVQVCLNTASATDVNNADDVSATDNGDGTITISTWKATSGVSTVQIAATVAVNVWWMVLTD